MIGGVKQFFARIYAGAVNLGNYFEIEPDGTPVQHGDATVWDDITGSLVARRLESVLGRLQYDYTENAIIMQDNGSIGATADRLIFNFQKPHGAKVASEFRLHVHWEQTFAGQVDFTLQYRIQKNGQAKTTAWTTVNRNSVNDSIFPYVSGTLNQITRLAEIDLTSSGISATIEFRLARTDNTGLGDILATFADGHIEFDMNGSRQEYAK